MIIAQMPRRPFQASVSAAIQVAIKVSEDGGVSPPSSFPIRRALSSSDFQNRIALKVLGFIDTKLPEQAVKV
jgi:hypothetical protein